MPFDQVSDVGTSDFRRDTNTPYRARKTAPQRVQFSIDPDFPVSRKRWFYASNGTDFDTTNITGQAGEIELSTTATGADTTRLRTAISGKYVSHALAEPGQAIRIPETHLSYGADGAVQLSHGRVIWGAFTYDEANAAIKNGLGCILDSSGLSVFLRKESEHVGDSPVAQSDWNLDTVLDPGAGNGELSLSEGVTWNQPYTWYNSNPLTVGYVDAKLNRLRPVHQFRPKSSPTIGTPNLPVQFVVDNQGTASPLELYTGGVQYSTFGGNEGARNVRQTVVGRTTSNSYIDTAAVHSNNAVDPLAEPGVPLVALQRRGRETMPLNISSIETQPTNDIWVFVWDEYGPATALTGENFRLPHSDSTGSESQIEVDTEATSYSPESEVLREVVPLRGGDTIDVKFTDKRTSNSVPDKAARVITAAHRGSSCDVDPIRTRVTEGY